MFACVCVCVCLFLKGCPFSGPGKPKGKPLCELGWLDTIEWFVAVLALDIPTIPANMNPKVSLRGNLSPRNTPPFPAQIGSVSSGRVRLLALLFASCSVVVAYGKGFC